MWVRVACRASSPAMTEVERSQLRSSRLTRERRPARLMRVGSLPHAHGLLKARRGGSLTHRETPTYAHAHTHSLFLSLWSGAGR